MQTNKYMEEKNESSSTEWPDSGQTLEEEETTKGGIIIPDSAKEKPAEGEVIAVGKGKLNDKGDRVEMDVKVGGRVLFSKYGGTDVKFDGVDHLIMREDDILAVIEG